MVALFGRKQKPAPPQDLHALLDSAAGISNKFVEKIQLNHQKIAELEEGLRQIVSKPDLTEKTLKIRKSSISELVEKEMEEMQNELMELKQLAEVIKGSIYEELLQQASAQKEVDENQFDHVQTLMQGNEARGSMRHIAVGKAKQAGLEYKRLAKDLNRKVNNLKTLAGGSNAKLIESERKHIDGLISTLTAHLDKLNKIKNQMERNPNLEQVQQAKDSIRRMLAGYDIREGLSKLNEIRAENAELENNLNEFFKEAGAIEDLERQIAAKAHEIIFILKKELDPNNNLLVL
tara:strand:- start:1869 stop:2741 length:873 start_codon:yes stop_codon:yes gene_type:complete